MMSPFIYTESAQGGAERHVPLTSMSNPSIVELAARRNRTASEALLDLVARDAGREALFFEMSEANVERILGWDYAVVGTGEPARPLTDTRVAPSIHPRARGTFPRVLRRYVRDKRTLSLEEAVRRMTSLPAERLRLGRRGRIEPGCAADLVLMASASVADRATFGDPTQLPVGIEHVVVAGRFAVRDGKPTGVKAGRVLRRG